MYLEEISIRKLQLEKDLCAAVDAGDYDGVRRCMIALKALSSMAV